MRFFTVDEIELIHMQIIDTSGGLQGTRDRGRLESAVASQTQIVFGEELYKTVFEKAAALCRGIIADHPFAEGNKRTGIMLAIIFLEHNGYKTTIDDKELENFAVRTAVDHVTVTDISAWLRHYTTQP